MGGLYFEIFKIQTIQFQKQKMFEHKLHEPHPTIVYPRIPVIFIMHGNNAPKKMVLPLLGEATYTKLSILDDFFDNNSSHGT